MMRLLSIQGLWKDFSEIEAVLASDSRAFVFLCVVANHHRVVHVDCPKKAAVSFTRDSAPAFGNQCCANRSRNYI